MGVAVSAATYREPVPLQFESRCAQLTRPVPDTATAIGDPITARCDWMHVSGGPAWMSSSGQDTKS